MSHTDRIGPVFLLMALCAIVSATSRAAAPQITSSQFATGSAGTPFSYQIVASNAPTSYAASGLPAELVLDTATGLISGTPVSGFYGVQLSATNADGTGTRLMGIGINQPGPGTPQITSPLTASGDVGTPFNYTITATGDPTITFFAANLPPGLAFNSPAISGSPTQPGTFEVFISATNGNSGDVKTLTVTISGAPLPAGFPQITSPLIYPGLVNEPFGYSITATGDATISFGASSLPPGLLRFGSTIFGAPTQTGVFQVTLTATNAIGTDTRTLTLLFGSEDLATLEINSALTATAMVGVPFDYTITASGLEPISFSTSALPPGLSLSGEVISGTPAETGSYSITLNASNAFLSDSKTLALTVILLDSDSDGVPDVQDADDDNDGFTDAMELAFSSSTTAAASTPFSLGAVSVQRELRLSKIGVKLNFSKPVSDAISFSGELPVPAGFVFTARRILFDIGGVAKDVTLDSKGKSPRGNSSVKIAAKPKNGFSKFSAKFGKGDFGAELAGEGFVSADLKDKQTELPVVIIFNGEAFEARAALLYSAKAGKSGKTKQR